MLHKHPLPPPGFLNLENALIFPTVFNTGILHHFICQDLYQNLLDTRQRSIGFSRTLPSHPTVCSKRSLGEGWRRKGGKCRPDNCQKLLLNSKDGQVLPLLHNRLFLGKLAACLTFLFHMSSKLLFCPAREGFRAFHPFRSFYPPPNQIFTTDLHPTCNPPCHPQPGFALILPLPSLCPLCSQVSYLPAPSACAGPTKATSSSYACPWFTPAK